MEQTSARQAVKVPATESLQTQESFQPRGAIAFFILLIVLGLIIWFGIYFLMLQRS